jgi:NAD(P)H-flavin reductase
VAHVDPVAGIIDPMLLRAWLQAQLEQQAVERQGSGGGTAPRARTAQREPNGQNQLNPNRQAQRTRAETTTPPEPEFHTPDDGFRQGDQSYLRTLQSMLRHSLAVAGDADGLGRRLAERLPFTGVDLHGIRPADLGAAIVWLVDNLHRPHVVSSGCGQFGPAVSEVLGGRPQPLDAFGQAMLDALRGALSPGWRREYDEAWRSAWAFTIQWIRQGMETLDYEPPFWTGEVVEHDRRRADVAVVHVRTYLRYPYRPGQYAIVESALRKEAWRPFWIASLPSADSVVELHVQAAPGDEVAEALVQRTAPGDTVRLRPAAGEPMLAPPSGHDLLLIAGGVGVAPMKALLAQLRERADERVVHLFWGVRNRGSLYDLAALRGFRATVVPVVAEGPAYPYHSGPIQKVVAAHGDWHNNDVYVTGPAAMVRATVAMLVQHGVPRGHITTGTT